MKSLSILEGAFRASLEEQDDAALWFVAALRNCGSEPDVVLAGEAAHYALADQGRPVLRIGDVAVENPPSFEADIRRLLDEGGVVWVVEEDLAELGLAGAALIEGVARISRAGLWELAGDYEHLWFW